MIGSHTAARIHVCFSSVEVRFSYYLLLLINIKTTLRAISYNIVDPGPEKDDLEGMSNY